MILSSSLSELIKQAKLLQEDGECRSSSFPPRNRPIIDIVPDGESVLVDVIIGILVPGNAHRLSMRWPSTTNHCCLSGTPHARRQILELIIWLTKPVSVSLVSVEKGQKDRLPLTSGSLRLQRLRHERPCPAHKDNHNRCTSKSSSGRRQCRMRFP